MTGARFITNTVLAFGLTCMATASASARQVTFQDRVAAQRAIEQGTTSSGAPRGSSACP
jgi:hypothetical protein